jgi:tetratricopeptide (TPR) repeat protein
MEPDAGNGMQIETDEASAEANAPADLQKHAAQSLEILRHARAAHERNALSEAERGYREVLSLDPDQAEALHFLGVLHFQYGKFEEADALLRRSIEQAPSALALANHASVLSSLARQDEALACLDRALELNPSHRRAQFLRAGVLADLGHHAEAVTACDHLLEQAPAQIEVLCRRGAALHMLARYEEALAACDQALTTDPKSFEALRTKGHALCALNRFGEGLESYGRALAIVPDSVEVLLSQGKTFAHIGRVGQALTQCNEALAIRPDSVDALFTGSVMLERLGRFNEAIARCERALKLNPTHAGALANRGKALRGLDRDTEALASYDASLDVEPRSREVLCNRAEVLVRLKRRPDALDSCERAIALDDTYPPAWYIQGRIFQQLHRYDEALVSFDHVLSITPGDTDALLQRGHTLCVLMRHDEALTSYEGVLSIDSEHTVARYSRAFLYLTVGDFERGWLEYEWRWREEQVGKHKRAFAQQQWAGTESLEGKTILLHAEQGLGDTIQFCRYASLVKARGARVVLEVQYGLKSLLARMPGVDQVVARGEPLPPFDFHCPLLSLGLAFQTDLASIPSNVPYLRAEPILVEKWRARLGARTRPRIGIAWSGNPKNVNDHNRSIPLERMLPLLTDEVEWISLQTQIRDDEQTVLDTSAIRHFGSEIRDFSDTAAIMQLVDRVICVDTSVAHLAGALNIPAWILVPYLPDWRWLLKREDSPWYPSVRLFRQSVAGDWNDVCDRVADALSSLGTTAAAGSLA